MNAMIEVSTRKALSTDILNILRFLRLMLEEMASMGGHAVMKNNNEWSLIKERIQKAIEKDDHIYLIAENIDVPTISMGFAEARILNIGLVFEPKKILHIHSVYVLQCHRRKGVGLALIEALLKWGREHSCVEAELDTLIGNPACVLYQTLGFKAIEMKMTRKLQ